jgi:hypothetical protein
VHISGLQGLLHPCSYSALFRVVLPVQVRKSAAGRAAFAILLMALVSAGEDLTCLPGGAEDEHIPGSGSAHHQPMTAFSVRATRTAVARIPSTRVTRPSAWSSAMGCQWV